MGWQTFKAPDGGFFLRRTSDDPSVRISGGTEVYFTNEADSHAAGEAVRLYLGRPRVSEMVAAKEQLERELVAVREELKALREVSKRTVESYAARAEAIEAGVFGIERTKLAMTLQAERQAWAKEREALQVALRLAKDNEARALKAALDMDGAIDRAVELLKPLEQQAAKDAAALLEAAP